MWFRQYRDYKIDQPLVKQNVEAGQGIVGCEMHDLNGWGETLHEKVEILPSPDDVHKHSRENR